ncbi:MAG: peroxiredoxin [Gammaproteobacteria bacterium]|nr:peroxiredoxin [Gammaproteobacteria bacterium]
MLELNQDAPQFSLLNEDNQTITLNDYKGSKNIILYFYPKDDTSGCTLEASQFTSLIDEFIAQNTIVIGVSKDNCTSHKSFINKYNLKVMLLADTSGELCNAYGVWQEKEKNGIKKMGIVRSTFIINKSGKLVSVEYGVMADGHAQMVLDKVKSL